MRFLQDAVVPVPRIFALKENETVLGCALYINGAALRAGAQLMHLAGMRRGAARYVIWTWLAHWRDYILCGR